MRRWLRRKAFELATVWDPLAGVYCDGDGITVAVPTLVGGESPVRYAIRHISGMDVCQVSPRVAARQLRALLGRKARRCAVALGLRDIFIGDAELFPYPDEGSRRIVTTPLPSSPCSVIAAKQSLIQRWRIITRHAGLDLDILTAGPVGVALGLGDLLGETHKGCGITAINYKNAYFLCACRNGAIMCATPIVTVRTAALTAFAREWSHVFQGGVRWSVVVGGEEAEKRDVLAALAATSQEAPISLSTSISRLLLPTDAYGHSGMEIGIVSSIGLSAYG